MIGLIECERIRPAGLAVHPNAGLWQKGTAIEQTNCGQRMDAYWVAVGSPEHWQLAMDHGIWGLVPGHESRWKQLSTGAIVFFYARRPVSGYIGYGVVSRTFRQDRPLWPPEVATNSVMWPLRFEFDVVYLVPPTRWREERIAFQGISSTRLQSGFFALKEDAGHLLLAQFPKSAENKVTRPRPITHEEVQKTLIEVGQIQRYIAEPEYPIGKQRIDVVWRRMIRAVPTFSFEVQVEGDVFHALGKLKHAHEVWNSRIFLVGEVRDFQTRAEELLAGPFHEIRSEVKIIDVGQISRLHELKREVRETEQRLYLA